MFKKIIGAWRYEKQYMATANKNTEQGGKIPHNPDKSREMH